MHCLALHVGANFSSKCLLRDQINGATEHIFQVKQNTKILRRRSGSIEADPGPDPVLFCSHAGAQHGNRASLGNGCYDMTEIAQVFEIHYATVSRIVKVTGNFWEMGDLGDLTPGPRSSLLTPVLP